jgi:hypothetical protein
MLVKLLNENTCLNTDYVISLSCAKTKDKYDVVCGMIDGKLLVLASFDTKAEAEEEYDRLIHETNKKRD